MNQRNMMVATYVGNAIARLNQPTEYQARRARNPLAMTGVLVECHHYGDSVVQEMLPGMQGPCKLLSQRQGY